MNDKNNGSNGGYNKNDRSDNKNASPSRSGSDVSKNAGGKNVSGRDTEKRDSDRK